jgi:hypothetical protein
VSLARDVVLRHGGPWVGVAGTDPRACLDFTRYFLLTSDRTAAPKLGILVIAQALALRHNIDARQYKVGGQHKDPNKMSKADIRRVMQEMGRKGGRTAASRMTKAQRIARATKASRAAAAKKRGGAQ